MRLNIVAPIIPKKISSPPKIDESTSEYPNGPMIYSTRVENVLKFPRTKEKDTNNII